MKRVSAAAFAIALVGVIAAAPARPAGAAPCAASPASVAVIVDFGDGSAPSAVCVPADSTDNGAAVLAARAEQLGTPPPRFDSSGFVCGIDGYPADGCGEQTGSTYAYWSYWHGTSSWEYSNVGPGGSRIRSSVSEGWRFQPHGAGNPSDPPPTASPEPAATCAPATTTAPTTTTIAQAPPPSNPTTTTTTTTNSTNSTKSTTETTSTTTSTTAPTSASQAAAAASAVRVTTPSSSSSPWPATGAGVVIVGLAVTGFVVSRRRASSSP